MNNSNNNGPRQKTDQVIYEAIAKACEIVVSSRGNSLNSGTTATNTPSSSRFNLQVPEIPGVRNILQNYRLALHVPIRLDVYYQHDGGRRELLERWCLEYQPAPTERFLQAEGIVTQDHIVQLRHVCKRIVLWLRTLYCWSRLLPAQAFSSSTLGNNNNSGSSKPPIGFSIYVNSENDDDVSELTKNQGFRWQNQPSPVVTPYGELGWKVFYSPSSCIKRLLPQRPHVTASRPIPQQHHHRYHHHHYQQQQQQLAVPQSAPANFAPRIPVPARSVSSRNRLEDAALPSQQGTGGLAMAQQQQKQPPQLQQHTYHAPPRLLFQRSHSARDEQLPSHHAATGLYPLHQHQLRHTSIESSTHMNDVDVSDVVNKKEDGSDEAPVRVMSGLSLALMMDRENGIDTANPLEEKDDIISEKRHAALHEVPPHLVAAQNDNCSAVQHAPATAEYGYAYNSHIPWQRIHPSSNPPVVGRSSSDVMENHNNYNNNNNNSSSSIRYLGTSPSALGSTPPSGAFSGSAGRMTPPTGGFLLRPGSLTPPFQPRPAGFVQEAPQQHPHRRQQHYPETPSPPAATSSQHQQQQQQRPETPLSGKGRTSLDLLHSSPFQQQQQQQAHGSLLSSLSTSAFLHASGGNEMKHSMWSTQLSGSSPGQRRGSGASDDHDDPLLSLAEDMPFAVDLPVSSGLSSANSNSLDAAATLGASSSLYSSATVASFAQKCALTQNRLKLFDKSTMGSSTIVPETNQGDPASAVAAAAATGDDLMVSTLADQLAEFRSFEASLQQSSQPSGGSESATSTGTPISLRS